MDFKKQYLEAINNHNYNNLINIIVKNLIYNFNYESICDFGTCLCDDSDSDVIIKLNKEDCEILGKKMLAYSYYNNPDIKNALAFQFVCLERGNDFQTVQEMLNTAVLLNNCIVLNNIAYSQFKLGMLSESFKLQKSAIKISNGNYKNILNYNLMIYDLYLNKNIENKYDWKKYREMLISDDIYDYESAMILSIIFDDFNFVKDTKNFFEKTFSCEDTVKSIINQYLDKRLVPFEQTLKILQPKTFYDKFIYLMD